MEEPDGLRRAQELWQEAYRDQMDSVASRGDVHAERLR
jgi:hypothetical protein